MPPATDINLLNSDIEIILLLCEIRYREKENSCGTSIEILNTQFLNATKFQRLNNGMLLICQ